MHAAKSLKETGKMLQSMDMILFKVTNPGTVKVLVFPWLFFQDHTTLYFKPGNLEVLPFRNPNSSSKQASIR